MKLLTHLCPVCASGKVRAKSIIGGQMECTDCGWLGKDTDLVIRPTDTAETSLVAEAVVREYMLCLSKYASVPIGQAMLDAGLVGRKDSKLMARLLRAAVSGAHRATLEEIEQIQKEIQVGQLKPD